MKKTNINRGGKLLSIIFLSLITQIVIAQPLERNFKNPPPSARPKTWMHSMSSNMSKEGLTKDLEAMADVGIGGIILFSVSHFIPKGDVLFNSPEHIDMIGHAAAECERLGLSFGVHNCDGWTSSGGPWVTPENSMKEVVYSETISKGGKINLQLSKPSERGSYYEDIAVVAYPTLNAEISDMERKPVVTSSLADFDPVIATDGRIDKRTPFVGSKDNKAWVQFDFGQEHTVRSLYLNSEKSRDPGTIVLKTSNDGVNFTEVKELKVLRLGKIEYGLDERFEGIKARYFRLETDLKFQVSEIDLSSVECFDNMIARTSLFKIENHRIPSISIPDQSMVIKKDDILNLTEYMDAMGNLKTKLPKGNWTIMRFGYTITGAVNGPASSEGKGWEVDKMSREAFKTHYDAYVTNVINVSRPVAPNALQYMEIDSYEVGGQNWTKGYEKKFRDEYNYDLIDFLPLYAGRYIESAETTEKILWDMRNFSSKMMTDNYFDYFTELCHDDGLISYVEPYSFNASFNELDAARLVDIPMGEFWMHQRYQAGTAVSGARIYGKNVVSAESFSAQPNINWKGHPGTLKLTGDKAWTLGINEFMFHRYAHQANTKVAPGMTMSQWGSHIDRTQTWWSNAGKSWFKYLARGQYLLRQGLPVSDLLVFVGDGSPNSIVKRGWMNPDLPNHINFDCINADALVNRISVKDGKLTLPNGIQYNTLKLTNVKEIKLSTLKKISELADQGIIIIGDKPGTLGNYNVSANDQADFEKMKTSIWSKPTTYESGEWDEIFAENNIPTDLMIEGGENINYTHRRTKSEEIYFFYNPDSIARTYQCTFNVDGKIPELWNQMTGETSKLAAFEHINGKTKVAITFPAEGSAFIVFRESSKTVKSIDPSIAANNDKLKLSLSPTNQPELEVSANGEYPVKFVDGSETVVKIDDLPNAISIDGDWKVNFPDIITGNPNEFVFSDLTDWTQHANEEVKYYSGTATYTNTFNIKKGLLIQNRKFTLDLGSVSVAARVVLNGKDLGVVWMKPQKMDITKSLIEGDNSIMIEVTNLWTNRLIGDENFPNETGYEIKMDKMPEWYLKNEPAPLGKRKSFCTFPFYKEGDPLLPSGLLGPVTIDISSIKTIEF